MATQTLKYGTIVLIGLAVTGGIYYESARHQVYAKDCIEITEGVREREMIATAISGTNRITLQIATNRSSLVALDSVIVGLIPYFVNQEEISTWASGATTNPPHWTPEDLYAHVGLSASGMTPYPYQIRTDELLERFNILEHLVYTDTASAWNASRGGNTSYGYTGFEGVEFDSWSTNINISQWASPWPTNVASAIEWWEANAVPLQPSSWEDCLSHSKTHTFDGYTIANNYGATVPQFSWTIDIPMSLNLNKTASYLFYGYPDYWHITWSWQWSLRSKHTSVYRESNLASTTRSIPITRTDYFYSEGLLCTTNISSNTASSVSSAYVVPPGSFNPSLTHDREVCALDSPQLFYHGPTERTISYSATNVTEVVKSDSGSVSNDVKRNVIHKWDVERCRE